ncbi:MAG TPA: LLM class flavin-dependent oxidoreductase [Acidimicrobiia bacterium]|nr:LLM class flavin-dependent oxidoreductase [Acidimicrobiia bacterium]
MTASLEVGVGLWGMRATAGSPASWPALYRELVDDARTAESLGFDSFWLSEHRFWYDGWCPQPVVAAAAVAAATTRLRVGTAMHLLAQHDATRAAATIRTVGELSAGRLDLGVSLGYRPEEYAGLGLPFAGRVRRFVDHLDHLAGVGLAPGTRLFLGGMADGVIRRAARRGVSLLLPPTLSPERVAATVALARDSAAEVGTTVPRVGVVKDCWVAADGDAARAWYRPRLARFYEEYAGAWWQLGGKPGFARPDLMAAQVRRAVETAVVGDPAEVAAALAAYVDAGVDTFVLQTATSVTRGDHRRAMTLLAERVLPEIRKVGRCVSVSS